MFFRAYVPDLVTGGPPSSWLLDTARSILDTGRWFDEAMPTNKAGVIEVSLAFDTTLQGLRPGQWSPTNGANGVVMLRGTGKKDVGALKGGDIVTAYAQLVREAIDAYKPRHLVVHNVSPEHAKNAAKGIQIACLEAGIFVTNEKGYFGPDKVTILPVAGTMPIEYLQDLHLGLQIGAMANLQRWLAALPLNILNVESYAKLVHNLFGGDGTTRRHTHGNATDEGVTEPPAGVMARMRLLKATCQGAGIDPRVLVITIHPRSGPTEEVDIDVGKGLVMDDGGQQLKPPEAILGMKGDMAGSAACLAAALFYKEYPELLARTTVFVLVLAENRIDGKGCNVQDVVMAYNGKTYEDRNTDAEGRKVLVDAVAWIVELYPGRFRRLTTIATLTGAVLLAFGKESAGVMVRGNSRDLYNWYEDVGEAIGDPFERLRLLAAHSRDTTSAIADVQNVPGTDKNSGAQRGAAAIMRFVPEGEKGEVVHLDIARTESTGAGMHPKTPQHAGVWMLIETHAV